MRYLLLLLLLFSPPSLAKAVAVASQGDVTVTLHDTPCSVAAVSNLKLMAQWRDSRGVYQGCWGVQRFGQISFVLLYFDDKTVTIIPVGAFKETTGT